MRGYSSACVPFLTVVCRVSGNPCIGYLALVWLQSQLLPLHNSGAPSGHCRSKAAQPSPPGITAPDVPAMLVNPFLAEHGQVPSINAAVPTCIVPAVSLLLHLDTPLGADWRRHGASCSAVQASLTGMHRLPVRGLVTHLPCQTFGRRHRG